LILADIRTQLAGSDEARLLILPVTVRAKKDGDDEGDVLEGYAARFDDWTQIGGDSWGFMESIAPGAFAASLKSDDIRSFFNHDSNQVLGRTSAKTAEFSEDEKGLRAIIRPPDTAAARDVVTLIKRGDARVLKAWGLGQRFAGEEYLQGQRLASAEQTAAAQRSLQMDIARLHAQRRRGHEPGRQDF